MSKEKSTEAFLKWKLFNDSSVIKENESRIEATSGDDMTPASVAARRLRGKTNGCLGAKEERENIFQYS